MTTTESTAVTTQVHRVYIKATPEAIWEAITKPEWTNRYGYTGYASYDLRPGGLYEVRANDEFKAASEAQGFHCPDVVVGGEVIEADPPRRLVTTFRMLMDPGTAAEPPSRITHEITDMGGFCALTVTHELEGSPLLAGIVAGSLEGTGGGGGHTWVLSDLKSLLETGSPLAG
ncbi:SRPBCC domain-containing protein [Pseudonocardia saturnea]